MALPGFVRVGSERFRDRMRALSSGDRMALYELSKGEASGEVVRLELAPLCDPDTLRGCRELNTALSRIEDHDDNARGWSALDALGMRLVEALDARPPLADTADPFLALVELDPHFHHDGLRRAAAVLGRERVEALLDSLASEIPNGGADAVDLDAARRDPAAIEAWARERGLGEQAAAIAAAARPAYRLERASDDARAESRVGGSGLLAPGTAWPRSSSGDPLSFLAGIDLGELPPPPPGTDPLPDAGWLLFFAALDWENGRHAFEGDPTPNEDGALARVFWVPAGERPVPAEPPADLSRAPDVLLRERLVVATAQLTLEDGYDSAKDFGLDELQTEVYDEIAQGVGSSRVDLQACKLEYSIVSPK